MASRQHVHGRSTHLGNQRWFLSPEERCSVGPIRDKAVEAGKSASLEGSTEDGVDLETPRAKLEQDPGSPGDPNTVRTETMGIKNTSEAEQAWKSQPPRPAGFLD